MEQLNTEVLVVGGGTGGTAAAIQAARSGARVLLVSEWPWLGGMLTAAGVSAPDGNELAAFQTGLWGAFLRELEGGCQVPIGVNTVIDGETLTLTGIVASLDGQTLVKDSISGPVNTADEMGTTLAKRAKEAGAQAILDAIASENR